MFVYLIKLLFSGFLSFKGNYILYVAKITQNIVTETNIANKHERFKNPNWWEPDQLAIYKEEEELK